MADHKTHQTGNTETEKQILLTLMYLVGTEYDRHVSLLLKVNVWF